MGLFSKQNIINQGKGEKEEKMVRLAFHMHRAVDSRR